VGLCYSRSEITLLFDLSLDLDQTLAQRNAKSKVKVTSALLVDMNTADNFQLWHRAGNELGSTLQLCDRLEMAWLVYVQTSDCQTADSIVLSADMTRP